MIDLGAEYSVSGFHYLARQDGGWNGAIARCDFSVSNQPDSFSETAATATFGKRKTAQAIACKPVKGRYVLIRALSEVNGGPWASAAEFGITGVAE